MWYYDIYAIIIYYDIIVPLPALITVLGNPLIITDFISQSIIRVYNMLVKLQVCANNILKFTRM